MFDDDFFSFLQILTSILAGIVFVCAQYDLCISKPNEWFIGAVAGVLMVFCLSCYFHKRE